MSHSFNSINQQVKIGTILFLDGYQSYKGSEGNEHIVYNIVHDKWGTHYHTVERSTLRLKVHQNPTPLSQKFGIGIYFEDDYNFTGTTNELSVLVENAKAMEEYESFFLFR